MVNFWERLIELYENFAMSFEIIFSRSDVWKNQTNFVNFDETFSEKPIFFFTILNRLALGETRNCGRWKLYLGIEDRSLDVDHFVSL